MKDGNKYLLAAAGGFAVAALALLTPKKRDSRRVPEGRKSMVPADVEVIAQKWLAIFPQTTLATVLAICKIESDFNPSAENHAATDERRGGAYGLMQITGATAIDWIPKVIGRGYQGGTGQLVNAIAVKWRADGLKSLLVPDVNLFAGISYLDYLEEALDHDVAHVAAAYNSGLGSVKRALAAGNNSPDPQYVARFLAARDQFAELTS